MSNTERELVSLERIKEYEIIENDEKMKSISFTSIPSKIPINGDIIISHLTVKYRVDTPIVLYNLNLQIKEGKHITICGRTGSGKTTLLLCLLNLIKYEGDIYIGNMNIGVLDNRNYRNSVGIIPQESLLIDENNTIRYNIDPRNEYSDDEILKVLKIVGLERLIKNNNLNEKLNENETLNLSVGEKELLRISHLLLNKYSIILMDEALSSIDKETSDLIENILDEYFSSSTLVRVSHIFFPPFFFFINVSLIDINHLNNSLKSDLVLVLDKGEIVEYDNPQKLLNNKNSFFSKLYKQ